MAELLRHEAVLCHPLVVGELACGHLRDREQTLVDLQTLPSATRVTDDEALSLIENSEIYGRGIGYIDVHLLASALVSGVPLWTRDKALLDVAQSLEAAY